MKLKPKQKVQVLVSGERPPEVVRINGDVITFRAFFEIDPVEVIDSKINFCEFKVYEEIRQLSAKVKVGALTSIAALQKGTSRKIAARDASERVIVRGVIDLTKYIPNDRIAAISAGQPVRKQKKIRFTTSSDVEAIDVLGSEKQDEQSIKPPDLKSFYQDALSRKSRDPASELNLAEFHSPIVNVARGVRTTSDKTKLSRKQQNLRDSLAQVSTSPRGAVLEDEELSTIEIDFPIKMRKSQAKTYTVEITARAPSKVGQLGRPLQTLKLNCNFREAYEDHIIPTQAPQLQFSSVGSLRFMRIKQVDKNSTGVVIFRKNIQETSGPGGTQYKQIAKLPLQRGQEVQFTDRPGQIGKCIYRVVPHNEIQVTSGEFSSVVAPGSSTIRKSSEPDESTILAYEKDGGVQVSIFNIPNEVVSLRLLRKNLTINERSFSTAENVQDGPIRRFERTKTDLKMFDRPTRTDAVYEYKVMFTDAYGDERESLKSCIVHFAGNAIDQESYTFNKTSPTITNSSVNFQVDAPTNQASLDLIYDLLTAQGLEDQYAEEIKSNKQLFSKLVALEMLRFDTSTGLNESFGVVKTGAFEDSITSQKAANVSPLVQGRRYIYQFRLLLRSPGTVFSESNVSKIDLETGKSFTTNQKKFNAPKALKKGTLASNSQLLRSVTRDGQKFDASSSSSAEMTAGRTALTGQIDVTVPFTNTEISGITVEESPRGNIIRFDVNEGLKKIDHVIIYADYNGKLAPLRSLHFYGGKRMIYLDDRLKASSSEISYYAQLVFHDFSQGQIIGPAVERTNAS
jgi:hypothetical protein